MLTVCACVVGANRRLDDDGIMVAIYEDIQEEIKDQARAMREKEEQVLINSTACLLYVLSMA